MHNDIIICVADALAEQLAGCVACGSTQQQQQQQQMELKQANCQASCCRAGSWLCATDAKCWRHRTIVDLLGAHASAAVLVCWVLWCAAAVAWSCRKQQQENERSTAAG